MLCGKENQTAQGHRTCDKLCVITDNLPYKPQFIKGKTTLYGTSLVSPTSNQRGDVDFFLHDDAFWHDLPNMGCIGADDSTVGDFPECLSMDFFNNLLDEDSPFPAHGEICAPLEDMSDDFSDSDWESSSSSTPLSSRKYIPLYSGLDDALFGAMW
eukprot:GEMP01083904.1.p1 GENE.GEMP01083904.1~~GEMP01083904.1.p1  ORF type:complete len:156 (+),score=28.33 GEMP01083904.1:84-551(+)